MKHYKWGVESYELTVTQMNVLNQLNRSNVLNIPKNMDMRISHDIKNHECKI